ncbi:hypothetical protein QC761_300145 [Podospora bellae-mahoneyi]|uniref:Uncharacterized protein n=1 Tax=Podospora bellae-mahoneyi TaxID=2093777 RepID=A0ABR0FLP1_9PEZI|nr:hypothetical protein QC761_300145 [Podospora bellae-mahoneyi]
MLIPLRPIPHQPGIMKRLQDDGGGDGDDNGKGDGMHAPTPRTPSKSKSAAKRQRTQTDPGFSSPLTLIPTTSALIPNRLKMKPKATSKLTPSAIMGLPTVASQLPIQDCRTILSTVLSDREVRQLISHLVTSGKPCRRKTASYLSARFDELNTPVPDQTVAFDAIVTAVKSAFRPLSPDTISPSDLEAIMTARGVQTNIRYIHAASVWPASLGTRLNALKAILEINQHLIRSSLLRESRHQKVFEKECPALSGAVLHICRGLTGPESVVALGMHFPRYSGVASASHRTGSSPAVMAGSQSIGGSQVLLSQTSRGAEDTLEVEMRAQSEFFRKQDVFPEVVEAYKMLIGSKRTGTAVQAVPIGVVDIEEESEEDEEQEEEERDEEGGGEDEIPDTQETR